ncbi:MULTISPECIES: N-acetylmuramoyl-L-alanine amidase [Clostridium]|nr:N-acetylmuramoyl-L-alanine amidase [Clostridium sporogenes]EHN16234.1 N-acetylmuramoyl-L-alanine amidase [Clostridium sporogenes PA 3679]MCW6106897.1 N-acetylmuramoyl-L-alanine amidase [Clostridium sporogenes]MDU4598419.1 N-acetylmuramoyl-L-alanine amidase [Clostridium sporogenes]UBI11666.1 N-acetylmuramoyl-L-alanine amidase [Clostridium sporogenes]
MKKRLKMVEGLRELLCLCHLKEDMPGFNWSNVPVVLVEMGFSSNAKEERLLNTEEYKVKIVNGLTEGVKKAIN